MVSSSAQLQKVGICSRNSSGYFFLFSLCDKALPAAVLLALPVLPSRKTLEAAEAAFLLVAFLAIF